MQRNGFLYELFAIVLVSVVLIFIFSDAFGTNVIFTFLNPNGNLATGTAVLNVKLTDSVYSTTVAISNNWKVAPQGIALYATCTLNIVLDSSTPAYILGSVQYPTATGYATVVNPLEITPNDGDVFLNVYLVPKNP